MNNSCLILLVLMLLHNTISNQANINTTYAQVINQSGIKANQSTLSVQGQGSFTGGYLIIDKNQNQTNFAQGINTQNIENHLTINGNALQTGINISQNGISPTGLGYGTIDPVNKTSTTHSAITDQAGLNYINTENFNQQQTQNQLNQIINNDFNKDKAIKELNAQVVITTEFGKEAPKRIGDYAQNKELELRAQGNTEEAKKWAEGGVYRVALHTLIGVLGTGTVEGAITTGSVALSAPILNKISQQAIKILIDQGVSPQIAKNAVDLVSNLGIATITQLAGAETASTAMAVNVDAFNRQLHKQEKDLAATLVGLAKKKGLKRPDGKSYTLQDIEDALRWANSGRYNERFNQKVGAVINSQNTSKIKNVLYDNAIGKEYDPRLWNVDTRNGIVSMNQNFSNIKKPDDNLIKFIQVQASSYKYTWYKDNIATNKPSSKSTPVTHTVMPIKQVAQQEIDSRNAAIMSGNYQECAFNETVYCRQQDQKVVTTMNNASHFIPVMGKTLYAVTKPLAVASKIENEGFSKAVLGEFVSKRTENAVGSNKKISAVIDQMGVNDTITDCIYNNFNSQSSKGNENVCQ
ncbi:hypothetical protein [Moraxella cuniculi]|nr:hypothetical protein [Moraxella cuniculi]